MFPVPSAILILSAAVTLVGAAPSFDFQWRSSFVDQTSLVTVAVSQDGNHIYKLSIDQSSILTAFDANNGTVLWKRPLNLGEGASHYGPLVTNDGWVVVIGNNITALDPFTGAIVWTRSVSNYVQWHESILSVNPGYILGDAIISLSAVQDIAANLNTFFLVSVDSRSGTVLWNTTVGTSNQFFVEPAGSRTVAVCGEDGVENCIFIDALTGQVRWSVDMSYQYAICGQGTALEALVYNGIARDVSTGFILWNNSAYNNPGSNNYYRNQITSSPDGHVIVVMPWVAVKLNCETGNVMWKHIADPNIIPASSAVVWTGVLGDVNSNLALSGTYGNVTWLSDRTGSVVATLPWACTMITPQQANCGDFPSSGDRYVVTASKKLVMGSIRYRKGLSRPAVFDAVTGEVVTVSMVALANDAYVKLLANNMALYWSTTEIVVVAYSE